MRLNRQDELKKIAGEIKAHAAKKNLKYDCIIGASGGFDSTYVIYVAKKIMNLNPLVVKYDNGFSHEMSNQNLREACRILNVDLRIVPSLKNERGYVLNAAKALINVGTFFSICFSCGYILPSVVFKIAKEQKLMYLLISDNKIENDLSDFSRGFKLKNLLISVLKSNPWKILKFMYYQSIAQYYFLKLKLQFEEFSPRFFINLLTPWPVKPRYIKTIDISKYMAWDYDAVEKTLRDELNWNTPRKTKAPYFRFDCYVTSLMDASFKKFMGITEHALLCNWFAQTGLIPKEELEQDIKYYNSNEQIEKGAQKVFDELQIPQEHRPEGMFLT